MGPSTLAPDCEQKLCLLGPFERQRGGVVEAMNLRPKTRMLLGYLLMKQHPQSRQGLAALFFPQVDDPLGALRWHLSRIRGVFGRESIEAEGQAVCFPFPRECLDVPAFEKLLRPHPNEASTAALLDGVKLYRGLFLDGLDAPDGSDLHTWLLSERHRLKLGYEQILECLVRRFIEERDDTSAIVYAQRWIQSAPLQEEAHVLLMGLYARNGQRSKAQEQYQLLERNLEQQLELPPHPQTQALYQQLQADIFSPSALEFRLSQVPPCVPWQPLPVAQAGALPMVGRERELQRLLSAWEQVKASTGLMLLFEGEAGIGKSSLFDGFLQAASLKNAPRSRCYGSEKHAPYQLWRPLVEQLLSGCEGDALPGFCRRTLASFLPARAAQLDPNYEAYGSLAPNQLQAAVHALLYAATREAPGCLVMEDLHWADQASLSLLRSVACSLDALPLLLLGNFRAEGRGEPALERWLSDLPEGSSLYRLGPLSAESTRELVAHLLPEQGALEHEAIASRLYASAAGHPLFTLELARELEEEVRVSEDASRQLEALLGQKLQSLSPSSRYALEALAVWEKPASMEQLQELTTLREAALHEAIEQGLAQRLLHQVPLPGVLGESWGVQFRHPLIADFALGTVQPIRLQRLHQRAAAMLEGRAAGAAHIAHHWQAGQVPEKAVAFLVQAGQKAMQHGAYGDAIERWEDALGQLARLQQLRIPLMHQLAHAAVQRGQWQEAHRWLLQALDEADPQDHPQGHVQSLIALGWWQLQRGHFSQAVEGLSVAFDLSEQRKDGHMASIALGGVAFARRQQGDLQAAIEAYQEAHKRAQRLGHRGLQREHISGLCAVYTQRGEPSQALACFEQLLDLQREPASDPEPASEHEPPWHALQEGALTLSKVLSPLRAAFGQGDGFTQALELLSLQTGTAGDTGAERWGISHGLQMLGSWIDAPADAIALTQRYFQLAFQRQSLPGISQIAGRLGDLYRYVGQQEDAIACYRYKLSLALDLGHLGSVTATLIRMAEAGLDGATEYAWVEPCLSLALESSKTLGLHAEQARATWLKVRALFHKGRFEEASQTALDGVSLAQKCGLTALRDMAGILALQSALHTPDHTAQDSIDGLLQLEAKLAPSTQARCLLDEALAEAHARAQRPAEALRHKTAAAEGYKSLYAASSFGQYARRYQALTGHVLEPPAPAPPPPQEILQFYRSLEKLLAAIERASPGQWTSP